MKFISSYMVMMCLYNVVSRSFHISNSYTTYDLFYLFSHVIPEIRIKGHTETPHMVLCILDGTSAHNDIVTFQLLKGKFFSSFK